MDFLYGAKEGVIYKVSVVKETDKQVKLEDGNKTGRTVVKKSDIGRVMGERETSVVFSEDENTVKELWNARMEEELIGVDTLKETLKGWFIK